MPPDGFLTAPGALRPHRGNGTRNDAVERQAAASPDAPFPADAIDSFLRVRTRRAQAIHDSVRLFRRYPKLQVFYVSDPTSVYDMAGWYSSILDAPGKGQSGTQLTRGPFPTHLEARSAWLSR
ncbi:MAG: hypothetical protein H0W33_07340 [Gammaproteobacteria bacterium]|nr:hypothetical protein [Gammaproteobacteria bacterium]